jgi:hypothetical protein
MPTVIEGATSPAVEAAWPRLARDRMTGADWIGRLLIFRLLKVDFG